MKKFFITALIAVMGFGAQAQLVSTTSAFEEVFKEKKVRVKPKMEWYVKAGLNLMSINWGEHPLHSFNYDVTISGAGKVIAGFNVGGGLISYFRPSRPSDFYWGFEVGVSQVGGSFDSMTDTYSGYGWSEKKYAIGSSSRFFSGYVGPSIGWKKSLTSNISLDLHFSPEFLMAFGDGNDIPYSYWSEYSWYDYYADEYVTSSHNYNDQTYVENAIYYLAMRGGIGIWFNKFNVDLSYCGVVKISDYYVGFNNIILSVGYAF